MSEPRGPHEPLQPLGFKPLNKAWAKIEILLGLACVFFGLTNSGLLGYFESWGLFVLGGYLAMAGHRSHLYQSNNQLTALVIEEIRKLKAKE